MYIYFRKGWGLVLAKYLTSSSMHKYYFLLGFDSFLPYLCSMQIKHGCTRIVLLTKNQAIKIPNFTYSLNHFLKGWLANIHEYETWNIFILDSIDNKQIQHLLCPVKKQYLWGFITVMPRCYSVSSIFFQPHSQLLSICGDHKADNYGYYGGKLVCLDYGQ